jgi:hypothetical protein
MLRSFRVAGRLPLEAIGKQGFRKEYFFCNGLSTCNTYASKSAL